MKKALEQTIRDAGQLALSYFSKLDSIEITNKSQKDLVTEADIAVEGFIKDRLLSLSPDLGFFGEESAEISGKRGRWIVDPIDGTHSFVRGQYFWSISIALEIEGDLTLGAVYAPRLNDLYLAERKKGAWKNEIPIHKSDTDSLIDAMVCTGFACLRSNLPENNLKRFSRIAEKTRDQRRFGSAALDICLVADGQVDVFWEQHLNLYDIAAGIVIAKEAGATVTDFAGNELINPEEVLVTNGSMLEQILPLM